MSWFKRATGIAVAAISIAVGATFAAPSRAEETAGDSPAPFTVHAATAPILNVPVADQALVDTGQTKNSVFSAPVAEHAVATIDSSASMQPSGRDDEADIADARPKSLSELVNAYSGAQVPDREFECLAGAIYFESKGEPLAGQLAVAEVIINRAKSGRFPTTLCGVVKQRGQFSFVRGGQFPPIARGSAHWRTAVAIAHIARQQLAEGATPRALFFHARRVSPGWRLTRIGAVGNHVFYR